MTIDYKKLSELTDKALNDETEESLNQFIENIRYQRKLKQEEQEKLKQGNPYKAGDKVKLLVDIRDSYNEVWHSVGDVKTISYIHDDGDGVMFGSNLGTHYINVELVESIPLWKYELNKIDELPESNDSLVDQLKTLEVIAEKFGIMKAVHFLKI